MRKAEANPEKHGVSFHKAATVFGDPLALTYPDPDHSVREERLLTFGVSSARRVSPYREGTNLVLLLPDIAAAFPTARAVNTALQSLLRVAKQTANLSSGTTRMPRKRGAGQP